MAAAQSSTDKKCIGIRYMAHEFKITVVMLSVMFQVPCSKSLQYNVLLWKCHTHGIQRRMPRSFTSRTGDETFGMQTASNFIQQTIITFSVILITFSWLDALQRVWFVRLTLEYVHFAFWIQSVRDQTTGQVESSYPSPQRRVRCRPNQIKQTKQQMHVGTP
jgi:hypothetical protein